jgi:hypothetical protein
MGGGSDLNLPPPPPRYQPPFWRPYPPLWRLYPPLWWLYPCTAASPTPPPRLVGWVPPPLAAHSPGSVFLKFFGFGFFKTRSVNFEELHHLTRPSTGFLGSPASFCHKPRRWICFVFFIFCSFAVLVSWPFGSRMILFS